jgi:hypothetical protein
MSKCPKCDKSSCGDDSHTMTEYLAPELRAGDCLKVILLQVYDLMEIHNFQVYEIKALMERQK